MVGITLSPEQIRSAPPEVRRWLEQQLFPMFGLQPSAAELDSSRLAACRVDEVAAMLSLIQGMLPVVNVFFELGREGINVEAADLTAFRLADILRHTRLQTVEQVLACLDTISAAARRVRGDDDAAFYGLDDQGHCFVSAQTQHSIMNVWQQIVAARNLDASTVSAGEPAMAAPAFSASGVPASAPSCPIWSAPTRTLNPDAANEGAPDAALRRMSP